MGAGRLTLCAALLLLTSGCGDSSNVDVDVVAGSGSTASSVVTSLSPPGSPVPPRCAATDTASAPDVEAVAGRLFNAPIHAMVDRAQFSSMESVQAAGIALRLGEIVSVELLEGAPFDILPGRTEGDPPTNSFAGNSAFASSVLLEVVDGDGILPVSYLLAAGGSDVLASLGPVLEETDDDLLDGLCAVVATSDDASNDLVAIGVSEAGPAYAVTPAFVELVEASSTMADLAAAD